MGSKEYNPFARMDNIKSTTPNDSTQDDAAASSTTENDDAKDEAVVEDIPLTHEEDTTTETTPSAEKLPDGANPHPDGSKSKSGSPSPQQDAFMQPTSQESSRAPPAIPPKTYKQRSAPNIIDAHAGREDVELDGDGDVNSGSTLQSDDVPEGKVELTGSELEAFWNAHEEWKAEVLSSPLSVAVKDPIQADRSMMNPNPPVMYLVVAQPYASSVRRRYSDFEWLQKTLKQRYVGILVPPLPEKKVAGNFSNQAFIEVCKWLGLGRWQLGCAESW